MVKNRRVVTGLIILSVFLYACGSGYIPVENTKQHRERPIRWVKGKTDSVAILVQAEKHRVEDNFAITLLIPDVAKTDSLALSNVLLTLTEAGQPEDRYVLHRIKFNRTLPSGLRRVMLDSITGSRLSERQRFDLSEGGHYSINFEYSRGAIRHYPAKLSVRLEATLSGRKTSDTFHVSLDFRRDSEFEMLR